MHLEIGNPRRSQVAPFGLVIVTYFARVAGFSRMILYKVLRGGFYLAFCEVFGI